MLTHSVMAGASVFAIIMAFFPAQPEWASYLKVVLYLSIGFNLTVMLIELATPHVTSDAKRTVKMILSGRYRNLFWLGVILLGNIIPLILSSLGSAPFLALAGICVLIGSYITEHIWVQAPQQIPLS